MTQEQDDIINRKLDRIMRMMKEQMRRDRRIETRICRLAEQLDVDVWGYNDDDDEADLPLID
jgi:hypothetical protein